MVRNGASNHLSVRRREALAIGGMDAQFEKGAHREESDFCLRYTDRYGPLLFDPEATLVHLGDQSGGCRTWGINRFKSRRVAEASGTVASTFQGNTRSRRGVVKGEGTAFTNHRISPGIRLDTGIIGNYCHLLGTYRPVSRLVYNCPDYLTNTGHKP